MIRRIVVAALASLCCIALPIGQVQALPTDPAHVSVFASYAGSTDGPTSGSGSGQVERFALVDPPGVRDYAHSRAIAVAGAASAGGWAGGLSDVSGSPKSARIEASSSSRFLEFYEVLGSGHVQFNMWADIDGKLSGGNFSAAGGSTMVSAWVNYHVNLLIAGSPSQRLFTASARYDILGVGVPGNLTVSGDWNASAFHFSSTGIPQPDNYLEQSLQVRYDRMLGTTFAVDAGTYFALEIVLETGALIEGSIGLAARSNFLETGGFMIDTDQDGAGFRPIDEGDLPPIPEPGTGVLVSIGLMGLATLGGRVGRI